MKGLAFTIIRMLLPGLLLTGSPASAGNSREIGWQDLIVQTSAEFDDPFAELSGEQLMSLARIARVRRRLDNGLIPADGPSSKDEKRSVAELSEQGIDVDWLLSQRERVTRERKKRAEQVDQELVGTPVRIPGYTLPLATDGDRNVTDLLLVPWVGACIHTPPPPPNQMIHVSVPGGTDIRGRFSAVWIEGVLEHEPATHHLFLVDGSRDLKVTYSMVAREISDYSPGESDTLAKVEIPGVAFEGHGWLQTMQAKISMIFTRAMDGLRQEGSSTAFWFAILVALGYGFVHTLGPGHGKAVVISYFVGDGGSFRKGIRMGMMIAVFHVLSSIVVVLLADFAVRQATGQAPSDYRAIRLGSYAAIAAIGGWMLWKALRKKRHNHDHDHSHDSENDHHHDGCDACAALQKESKGMGGWLALAVGSVPCTGALLVLLFGMANDLLAPAILMVVAISAGMAIAMSGIGILAIIGRRAVDRRMTGRSRNRFAAGARIVGASAVLTVGTALFCLVLFGSRGGAV